MKKITAIVIAVVLCICMATGGAAEFDLSGLSVNELNELIAAAQNEILAKGGDVIIPGGKHEVGVAIAAGTYDIKFADESRMAASYIIRDVEGNVFEDGSMTYGSWTHITLRTGQTIEFNPPCYIRKGTRLGF